MATMTIITTAAAECVRFTREDIRHIRVEGIKIGDVAGGGSVQVNARDSRLEHVIVHPHVPVGYVVEVVVCEVPRTQNERSPS